jgi:hypothetical protein
MFIVVLTSSVHRCVDGIHQVRRDGLQVECCPVATAAPLLSEGMNESWSISACKGPVGTAVSCMVMWLHWQVTSILGTGERSASRSDRFTCDRQLASPIEYQTDWAAEQLNVSEKTKINLLLFP